MEKNYFEEETDLKKLVKAFQDRTLERKDWTHEAHLAIAIYYLSQYPSDEAICYLRANIISYNTAVGTENTPERGYHETLTLFWATIAAFYCEQNNKTPLFELTNQFIRSKWATKNLPLDYYTREHLFSTKARAFWTPPNLQPMPIEIL
ncbi:MAG: hypothetical protein EAZ55_08915 [Cytophagales bacterium]|nr:MAG: hypothetical protein EAZ55_08915 [Cytophagales bacterium]